MLDETCYLRNSRKSLTHVLLKSQSCNISQVTQVVSCDNMPSPLTLTVSQLNIHSLPCGNGEINKVAVRIAGTMKNSPCPNIISNHKAKCLA
jgi:hypothetical protein